MNYAVKVSITPRNSAHHALTWCHSSATPPALLTVAGGRTDTTMTAVMTAAAAVVMTRVARVMVAVARA